MIRKHFFFPESKYNLNENKANIGSKLTKIKY